MPTKEQLFEFEQKQQSTFKDNGLDFISNGTIEDTAKIFINKCKFDKYSLSYQNGKAEVVGYKGRQTVKIKIEKTEYCRSIEATTSYSPGSKSDLTSDIIALRQQGKTQSEVAEILNMSQSYVSKIERNHNNNKNN